MLDLRVRFSGLGGTVDPDDAALALLAREAGDHPRLCAARDGADDDRVEEHAERTLLLLDLDRPVGEPESAKPVVGCTRRDRVRLAPALLHLGQRLVPALLEADPKARLDQAHIGA